ncbi:unnamed protein product, partial [Mesorhabditis belari]|uniref:Fungal lipase-type domain-containing protein n=1 Tax=Mesorhabditis belari TaxID=2138241 RepID=A0AAF3EGT7_9BILA
MSCQRCNELYARVRRAQTVPDSGSHPSTLELAYMVNLEYSIEMSHDCLHKIPESRKATIKVKDMVEYLDERNWELCTRTKNKGFTCSSFINHPAKRLVIVHRGTQLSNLLQLKANVRIALNLISSSIVAAADWHTSQSILNNTLKLDEGTRRFVRNDYSVTITGHSLGGWLAQLCTLLRKHPAFFPVGRRGKFSFGNDTMLDMNQANDLHCVAFDSPGANAVLTRLKEDPGWLNGGPRDVEIVLQTLDITVYLANRNLVNWCGTHVGTVKTIDVMSSASFFTRWFNPIASHGMKGILAYFQNNSNA